MSLDLETATVARDRLRRVAIDPVTRVEGHGKVTILLDEDNKVHQVRLHIVEFRGFERFIQGRPYWEVPVMVQRLCGICPVSHHLAASKALDLIVGATTLTPTADRMRRLMHYGQILQSHALHFFHLSSPDLLFGFESEPGRRNIVGVAEQFPDIARKGILLRKYGQEVIRLTAGKRVHGTGAVPGGVNRSLSSAERQLLLRDAYQMIAWSREAVEIVRRIHEQDPTLYDSFGSFESNFMGMVAPDGSLDLYDGALRARDADGRILFDQVDYQTYDSLIMEEVKPWTYMKFPYLAALGPERGWYRVGPLARVQNCDSIPTPFADHERRTLLAYAGERPMHATLGYHWARMIEMLFAAETIKDLLHDDDIEGDELMVSGARRREGVGVIEAPRGTLFHHYQVGDDDLVTMANLIVSTTNNNQAMNAAVREVARRYLDGRELTEGLLNHIEVAIRAYDPCLSCATHALGRMPLEVRLVDAAGEELDRRCRQ
ncbi:MULTISPECIES: Ni/Fe hydrogenase subunit alpha [unclassified Thauera]|uniref:Ni/Fe hydrogenase subunit alpha n=1 Tax=unclassified Thauera TaxID=2609274 RepID=UPI0002D0C086|nr:MULTISPECIES: Ni/Fe hydrogenase subunit alpha [unclassified Thauera]ENO92567.1 nickel-dependent hydrogenase large subunit [Thauera sp. 28]HNR59802.1 Ni/Fe hydrogenase subunit alpha [Thauera sp.]